MIPATIVITMKPINKFRQSIVGNRGAAKVNWRCLRLRRIQPKSLDETRRRISVHPRTDQRTRECKYPMPRLVQPRQKRPIANALNSGTKITRNTAATRRDAKTRRLTFAASGPQPFCARRLAEEFRRATPVRCRYCRDADECGITCSTTPFAPHKKNAMACR